MFKWYVLYTGDSNNYFALHDFDLASENVTVL